MDEQGSHQVNAGESPSVEKEPAGKAPSRPGYEVADLALSQKNFVTIVVWPHLPTYLE